MFTVEELTRARDLTYKNWDKALEDEETIGFEFKGQWISNPFVEESSRFEFKDFNAMCEHYGIDNVVTFIKEILESK